MADATIKIDADTRGVFQQIDKIERAMGQLQLVHLPQVQLFEMLLV
jgi:hypothetical protein